VIRVSADYIQEGERSGAFKVIVRPDQDYLRTREGLTGYLKKGMTVNARFFIARRSLWQLFYEGIDKLFNPAMKDDPGQS
jgi:HlyD family secretion protein